MSICCWFLCCVRWWASPGGVLSCFCLRQWRPRPWAANSLGHEMERAQERDFSEKITRKKHAANTQRQQTYTISCCVVLKMGGGGRSAKTPMMARTDSKDQRCGRETYRASTILAFLPAFFHRMFAVHNENWRRYRGWYDSCICSCFITEHQWC